MAKLITKKKKVSDEPDEFLSFTQRFWQGIVEAPGKAVAVVGTVVGVLLVGILVSHLIERAGENRLAEIGQTADSLLKIDDDDAAGSDLRNTLEKMAEKHAGKETGGLALYYLADLLAKEGEYDRAAEIYGRIGNEYSGNAGLTALSDLALAYVHYRSGNNEKALESFEQLLGRQDSAVPETQIRIEMGRLFEEKGDLAAAAEMYRKVVEIDPAGDWSERAKARLALIGQGESSS